MNNEIALIESFENDMKDLLQKYNAYIYGELGYGLVININNENYTGFLEKDNVKIEKW